MPRILLVDDEEAVRSSLARLLVHDGHVVVTARNGREALRLFESEEFDLVITDVVMPEVDGLELLRYLRRMDGAPPVIVVSGGGRCLESPYLDLAKQFGAAAVLGKPIVLSELRAHVTRLAPVRSG